MTLSLAFEFDGASPRTLDLFEQLPQALAGRSYTLDHRPVAPPPDHPVLPWMRLLAPPTRPGRWACEQVLRRWQAESVEVLASALGVASAGELPPAGGPVPAVLWNGRRFHGEDALERLLAALSGSA